MKIRGNSMKIVSETIIFLMKMFANMAGSVIVATTLTCCVLGIFFAKPEKSNKLLSVCWGCKSLPFAQIGVGGCLRFALAEYSDYDGIGFEQYCYHKVACVGGEKQKVKRVCRLRTPIEIYRSEYTDKDNELLVGHEMGRIWQLRIMLFHSRETIRTICCVMM